MSQITAPYGFVPLSQKVVLPPWLQIKDKEGRPVAPPVHDVPFRDGLCGTLELEIVAETPIFIRGTDKSGQTPFKVNGKYAIPGTALRGALRNIVEIITHSRFDRINDHRYAVRDLNNRHLYGQHMADIVKDSRGRGEPMPLVSAGWLTRDGQDEEATYKIEVCDFAKFEYQELTALANQRRIRGFQPGNKQSSVDKYDKWGSESLEVGVSVTWKRPDQVNRKVMASRFGVARLSGNDAKGVLVMTGQPSRWVPDSGGQRDRRGNAKHHDFVFLPARLPANLDVTPETFRDFEFAHSDRGQQNRLGKSQEPNREWKFWEKSLSAGRKVPVFFLCDPTGKKVEAFGLAMMFRLPYKNSIPQAVANFSTAHSAAAGDRALGGLDFAEGLFGTVRKTQLALKGRVGISHALANPDAKPMPAVTAVLGAPKASYYPNYVEQDSQCPGSQPPSGPDGRPQYVTWMDPDGRPRGWKRYRAMTKTWLPIPPTGQDGRPLNLDRVASTFQPLPAGTRFKAHVDIHNLLPQELGALLWALNFGNNPEARHTLGMARPLGYGRSQIKIAQSEIVTMTGQKVDLNDCRQKFVEYMESESPGWQKSDAIRELVALAKPVAPEAAQYQRLDPGRRINDFTDAKKVGLALPSAAGLGRSGGYMRSVTAATTGSSPTSASSGVTVAVGARVQATVMSETTKKGAPKFQLPGGQEAILHPTSKQPPECAPGKSYQFEIKSTGPIQLSWIDPDAPPPKPPTQSKPPQRPGGPHGGRR